MKRLAGVFILVASLLMAAGLTWSLPKDLMRNDIYGDMGTRIALEDGLSVMVTDVSVTRELTGAVERQTEQLYLVIDVDVFLTDDASPQVNLLVSSGQATFTTGDLRVQLPRYTNPGFVTHCRVPVLIDPTHLTGAQAEISASALLIIGFHRVAHIDLGLNSQRAAELLAQADTPVEITQATVEVI